MFCHSSVSTSCTSDRELFAIVCEIELCFKITSRPRYTQKIRHDHVASKLNCRNQKSEKNRHVLQQVYVPIFNIYLPVSIFKSDFCQNNFQNQKFTSSARNTTRTKCVPIFNMLNLNFDIFLVWRLVYLIEILTYWCETCTRLAKYVDMIFFPALIFDFLIPVSIICN